MRGAPSARAERQRAAVLPARLVYELAEGPGGPPGQTRERASPDYLARRGVPSTLDELADHDCLPFRFHTSGNTWRSGSNVWRLRGPEGSSEITVDGPSPYAVYPSGRFLPPKVRVLIDFLADSLTQEGAQAARRS